MKNNALMIVIILLLAANLAFTGWVKYSFDKTAARLEAKQQTFMTDMKNTLTVQDAMLDRLMHPGL